MGWAPPARSAIGGRWAISVPGAAVMAGLFVVTRILKPVGDDQRLTTVAAALAGAIAGALVLLAGHLTLFRHRARAPVPVPWVVALGALAGAAAGAVGLALAGGAPVGIVSAALQGAWSLPVVAFLLATRAAYADERRRLLAVEVRLEGERLLERGVVAALRNASHRAEGVTLAEGLRGTDQEISAALAPDAGVPSWSAASESLRRAAQDVVRPMSHRLWAESSLGQPQRDLSGILGSAMRLTPLATWPVAGLTFAALGSAAVGGTMSNGPMWATALLASASVVIIYALGNAVLARVPHHWRSTVGTMGIIGAAAAASAFAWMLGAPEAVRGDVFVGLFVLALGMLAAITGTARLSQQEVIDEIRRRIGRAEVEIAAMREVSRRIDLQAAQHLHGTVQARLVAAAYAIDDAGRRGDDRALADAVAVAREALDVTLDEITHQGPVTIADLCDAVDLEWGGLIGIDMRCDVDGVTMGEVGCLDEVLRQALLNAVVHGGATHVAVEVSAAGPQWLLVAVTDDGRGPQNGPPGIGSNALDAVTGGHWSLAPVPSGAGSVLTARIPRAPMAVGVEDGRGGAGPGPALPGPAQT